MVLSMNVPLLDLKAQYESIKSDLTRAVLNVLESQHFILGPEVERCEEAIAAYCGTKYGVGMSSGTDALLICLMAEGIGAGDEVITTPYTFFATAGAVARVGATPVFVDIDPATYNLDPRQIESRLTPRTKAIIPVHLYGQPADMNAVMAVAEPRGVLVIEDAAQAIGAVYDGRRAGSIAPYGCLSFFPSKNLGAAGDAGMVVTDDATRADRLRVFRAHGSKPKYYHHTVGGNFRLDAMQAAVVSAKLPHLDSWTDRRNRNAERYARLFATSNLEVADSREWSRVRRAGAPLSGPDVVLPAVATDRHVFNQYVVRVASRDALRSHLQRRGVGTEVYYPVPLHLQGCFAGLGHVPGDFPESELAAKETLALPIYPELTDDQTAYVVQSIREFFEEESRIGTPSSVSSEAESRFRG
jgi:dTDP-4-amino-4,6-dideoxygalactose transaminase